MSATSRHRRDSRVIQSTLDGAVDKLQSVLHAGMEDPNATYHSCDARNNAIQLAFRRARAVLGRYATQYRAALPFEQVTALHFAAVLGIEGAVVALIDAGAHIDAESKHGISPLCFAAVCGNTACVRALLAAGADVEKGRRGHQSRPPLYLAIGNGHADVVCALLKAGADLCPPDPGASGHLCPLTAAINSTWWCSTAWTAMIDALLSHGVDINTPGCGASSVLNRMIWCLDNGADMDQAGRVFAAMVERGADVGAKECTGSTPLHEAACRQYIPIMQVLIDANADLNAQDRQGESPLHRAIRASRNAAVELLLAQPRVGLNIQCNRMVSPLELALNEKNEFAFRRLIEAGADLRARCQDGPSIMHAAAKHGWLPAVTMLLESGISPTGTRRLYRGSPLYVAARFGHSGCMRVMLDAIEHVDTDEDEDEDEDDQKPWLAKTAIKNGHAECLQLLLDDGVPPDAMVWYRRGSEPKYENLLHIAAKAGQISCLQLLLKLVSKVDEGNWFGSTPLHLASEHGHADCVRALLDAGADCCALDYGDISPAEVALQGQHAECLRLLLEKDQEAYFCWDEMEDAIDEMMDEGNTAMLQVLMDAGKLSRWDVMEFLDKAITKGNAEFVRMLLAHDAPPDDWDDDEYASDDGIGDLDRLLHIAAASGQYECAKLLLEAGANPASKDYSNSGRTPAQVPREITAANVSTDRYNRTIRLIQQYSQRAWHLARFRRAVEAQRDAAMVFNAAKHGRPMELDKRLRLGKLAGGLERMGDVSGGAMGSPMLAAVVGGHDGCVRVLQEHGGKLGPGDVMGLQKQSS